MTLEPVQMLWIGSRLSNLERLSIASFLANGHPVDLYAYGPIDGVPAGASVLDARAVYPESAVFTYSRGFGRGSPSAFANQFRYKVLRDRGGAWSDTDMVLLRPLAFLAEMEHVIATQRQPPEQPGGPVTAGMNPCFMKAPAASAAMAACLAACESQAPAALTWGTTGPALATRVFLEQGLMSAAVAPDVFCPVDFWRVADLLGPPLAPGPRWHAIHCWNEMWRAGNLDKDARYRPDCLYESLKRRYGV